ncbi:MAG: DUF1573 domain-containing protein [Desulfobacteraceae bacterium]|nr:DUF1573 domain-containing protein [Desulfobacteraceae bacterium]
MKKKIIVFAVFFALFFLPSQGVAKQQVWIDNPVFKFELIPEGVKVPHAFIIKNTGDTLLTITNVLPP